MCLSLTALMAAGSTQTAQATAGINSEINYQARLLNSAGATVPDGNYNLEFKIYSGGTGCVGGGSSPCSGTLLWTEDWLNNSSQGVPVTNGYFSVMLGAAADSVALSTLNFNQTPLWLSINIGNTNGTCSSFSGCSGDGEMLPFTQFAAAPYAFDAAEVGGVGAANLVQLQASIPGTAQTGNFNITGTGIAGVLDSGQATIEPASDSLSAPNLVVENSTGGNILTVAASSSLAQVGINLGSGTLPDLTGNGLQIQGALQLSGGGGSNVDTFVTPDGSNVATKINIPSYDPGAFGQVLALGIPSSAASSSRVISVFDDRGSAHQPSLGVFSPDEGNIVGLSWDGSNTIADIETTGGAINLDAGGSGNVGIGTGNGYGKTIQIGPNGINTNTTTYQLGVNTAGSQDIFVGSPDPSVTANSGTTVSIQGGVTTDAIQIGTTASYNDLLIGSTYGSSTSTIQGGSTGGVALAAGATSETLTNSGDTVQVTGSGSTTAFQIQNPLGTIALFDADTANMAIGIAGASTTAGYALNVTGTANTSLGYAIGGTSVCTSSGCTVAATSGIQNGSSAQTANFNITGNGTIGGNLTATGATNLQDATNSATAFQVQNAPGTDNSDNVLNVNTVYNAANLIANGSFEQDSTGWAAENTGSTAPTIGRSTSLGAPFGTEALTIATTGTPVAAAGAKYVVNMTASGVYNLSFYAKTTAAMATLEEGWSNDGSTNLTTGCTTTNAPSTTDWNRFDCVFTYTGTTNNGVSYIFIGQSDATTNHSYEIDGVDLENVASGAYYKEGTLDTAGLALGNTLIQPVTNSGEAFVVASVAGVTGLRVNTDSSTISTAFAATFTSTVAESGTVTQGDTSTAALQVRNATSLAPLLKLDTSTINNSDTNGSFENSTSTLTGYTAFNTPGADVVDTTAGNAYEGANTAKITGGTATANNGLEYKLTTTTMASSTEYTLSFYAKLVAGQSAFTTLNAGYSATGAASPTLCTLNSNTVTLQWQRFTCTFTTGTSSGTPYVYIGESDQVAHQYYLDAVQYTTALNAGASYHEGLIQLNGTVSSPATFESQNDSTTAFQIQNAEGNSALNIDTTSSNILVNSGFENGGGNWQAKGTTSAFGTDSTAANVYQGSQALKATVTAASSGVSTVPGQIPFITAIAINTQYQLTFFAKCDSTYSTFTYGRQDVSGTDVNSTTSGTCTTSWQQYTAHYTTGGTITNPNIYVDLGTTTAGTIWIDDVSLVPTTTSGATNYAVGNIGVSGIFNNPAIFQNSSNSTTAFQIQNASGTSLFTVDTTGSGRLTDGGALTVAGAVTLSANANALMLTSAPSASSSQSLIDLGAALSGGSSLGTFIGVNATSGYTGDLVNLQVNGTSEFDVDASGDVRQGNGVSIYNTGSNSPSVYGTSSTMTTADLLLERFVVTSAGGLTLTTPTAAAIVAAVPHAAIGDSFSWVVSNSGGSGDTLAAGSGVTLTNAVTAIGNHGTTSYVCVLTNVTGGSQAVSCY